MIKTDPTKTKIFFENSYKHVILDDRRKNLLIKIADTISHVYANNNGHASLNFVCTHNSRRSQLGQAWAFFAARYRGLHSDDIEVHEVLVGPEDTPYYSSTWLLYSDCGIEYPMKAPKMRFDQSTSIKPVNVNGYGRISHSIFGRDCSPDTSIRDILNHVYGLLLHPDWDDPLDSVLK